MRRTSIAIIVLASVVAFFAVFAVWAKRQILETNTWTETSTQVLANHDVQSSLNTFLVDALFKQVNVEHRLKKALPDKVQGLAGPATAGIHELATRAGLQAIQSPTFQSLWAQANAKAHDAFLQIIEGGNETLSTEGGVVNLDLGRVVTQVAQNAGVDVKGKIPPKAARIELLRSDQLGVAQDAVNVLRVLDLALPALALALFALAIYLPRGWRREAVRASGFAFVAVGILVLVARSIAGGIVVDTLAKTDAVRPAADAVWGIATSLLRDEGVAMIAYGALIVVGAWLAGKTAPAREIRRALTPGLTRRAWGYPALARDRADLLLVGPHLGNQPPAALARPNRALHRRVRGTPASGDARLPRGDAGAGHGGVESPLGAGSRLGARTAPPAQGTGRGPGGGRVRLPPGGARAPWAPARVGRARR